MEPYAGNNTRGIAIAALVIGIILLIIVIIAIIVFWVDRGRVFDLTWEIVAGPTTGTTAMTFAPIPNSIFVNNMTTASTLAINVPAVTNFTGGLFMVNNSAVTPSATIMVTKGTGVTTITDNIVPPVTSPVTPQGAIAPNTTAMYYWATATSIVRLF